MKKVLFPIIAIALLSLGLVLWQPSTYSVGAPYPNPNEDEPLKGLSACTKTTANQVYFMRQAWMKNLDGVMAQEKPTSEKVDEAYESMATYRCWLDYLCEAVLYSGMANPKTQTDRQLSQADIDPVSGCANPENVQIPDLKIQYMSACKVSDDGAVTLAQNNWAKCRAMVERDFAGDNDQDSSAAYLMLENALKSDSGDQLVRPLKDKFSSILMKMKAMEGHMTTLQEQVVSLDARMPCFVEKCD